MWSLMEVNEKKEQGGGRGPVVGGEDHLPAEGKAAQMVFTIIPRYHILLVAQ